MKAVTRQILGVVFGLSAATAAVAQQPDAGTFRLFQGAQELGREVFRDDGTTLVTTVTIPLLNTKLAMTMTRSGARSNHAEIRAIAVAADTLLRTYTADVDGDSVRMSLTPAHGEARRWSKPAPADEIATEQSVTGIVSLIQRSNRQDRIWSMWLPSADSALQLQLDFTGDSVEIRLGGQQMFALLNREGKVRLLEVPVSRVRFERVGPHDSLPPLPGMTRPAADYRAPAGAPYTAEDISLPVRTAAGDTFSLGCTLTRPTTGGPRFPAAVTLTGSGIQDRDENLWPLLEPYHLYRQVADRLGRAGIAVLRCDDRGFASGGEIANATMVDFAADAAAKLAWLRARPDIDGDRLAIIGHSEGGIVGPMVAADDPRLAALVNMAGTAKTMEAVVRDQFLYPVETARGLTPVQRDSARAEALRQAESFINAPVAYLRQAKDYDPLPTARRVRQPVLILQGAVDRQVSAGQADTLAAALRAGGNRDVTVRVFPRLNHLFLVSPSGTGAPTEYASLTDAMVPSEVLDLMAEWLATRLRVSH